MSSTTKRMKENKNWTPRATQSSTWNHSCRIISRKPSWMSIRNSTCTSPSPPLFSTMYKNYVSTSYLWPSVIAGFFFFFFAFFFLQDTSKNIPQNAKSIQNHVNCKVCKTGKLFCQYTVPTCKWGTAVHPKKKKRWPHSGYKWHNCNSGWHGKPLAFSSMRTYQY